MADVYAALDVLVAPSRWEGFGLMLVEAMAAGIPIVTTRVGAIPEVTGGDDTAVLVPPRDPRALAHAVVALLAEAAQRRELAARARTRAAEFTWEAAATQLAACYTRVLGARPVLPGT